MVPKTIVLERKIYALKKQGSTLSCCTREQAKCLVFLMDLYLAKLPKFAFEKNILYLRPKRTTPSNPEEAWYDNVAVGKNSLRTMVKDVC